MVFSLIFITPNRINSNSFFRLLKKLFNSKKLNNPVYGGLYLTDKNGSKLSSMLFLHQCCIDCSVTVGSMYHTHCHSKYLNAFKSYIFLLKYQK